MLVLSIKTSRDVKGSLSIPILGDNWLCWTIPFQAPCCEDQIYVETFAFV